MVFKAHGVAVTWFQSGRASERAKRAERREDIAIQLSFKRLLLTRVLHVQEGSESLPNEISKHDGRSVS